MSKTKHTAGPWTFETFDRADEFTVYIGPEDEGRMIHTIFEGAATHGPNDGDPIADARLLAAAPEQNAALVGLVNVAADIIACYADVADTDSEPGWIVDLREALVPARAALAKAKGE